MGAILSLFQFIDHENCNDPIFGVASLPKIILYSKRVFSSSLDKVDLQRVCTLVQKLDCIEHAGNREKALELKRFLVEDIAIA